MLTSNVLKNSSVSLIQNKQPWTSYK